MQTIFGNVCISLQIFFTISVTSKSKKKNLPVIWEIRRRRDKDQKRSNSLVVVLCKYKGRIGFNNTFYVVTEFVKLVKYNLKLLLYRNDRSI